MKGTLSKFDSNVVVVPLRDDGISEIEQYRSALRNLHSQAVVDAQSNFVPNRVLGTTPPELSSFECYLSRSVRTTLAQLRSGSLPTPQLLQGPVSYTHLTLPTKRIV